MPGRFSLRLNRDDLLQQLPEGYDADVDDWIDEDEFVPRYNVAPRTQVPVIRHRDPSQSASSSSSAGSGFGSGAGDRDRSPDAHTNAQVSSSTHKQKGKGSLVLHTMKWGLVPHWSKHEDMSLNTINARAENLIEGGGIWASVKGRNRCAIPVQGYYEWQTKGKEKIPHFTKRNDGKILLLAGLYDCVELEGKKLWTFTIVTADAHKQLSWLHDRQPVILTSHDALMQWLDTSSQTWTPELSKMVQPYGDKFASQLQCYAVPKEVGKVGTESSTFIEPVAARKDGIAAMFAKQEKKAPFLRKPAPTKVKRASLSTFSLPTKKGSMTKFSQPSTVKVKASPAKSEPRSSLVKKEDIEETFPPSSQVKNLKSPTEMGKAPHKRKVDATLTIDLTNDDDESGSELGIMHKDKRPKLESS
ncbi:hypothetical protein D9619_011839 [Psilocybe cf. subviscida]|uniref:DUF159-domain-containing protein n=1 Tax=Psilocybe cf. subviscida TaxID=2480587 RepID=A0A8H5B0P4_9AGAR|nr:hypothetical protein D9619_011839 [Psilocybe cf. subviscida]